MLSTQGYAAVTAKAPLQSFTFTRLQRRFDFILDTVSAPHNYNDYVNLLTKPMGP